MNKQLFELYRNSERGKQVINLFSIKEDTDIRGFIDALIEYAKIWGCDIPIDMVHNYIPIFCDNAYARGLWAGELTRESWVDFVKQYDLIIPDYEKDGSVSFSDDPMAKLIRQGDYRNKASVIPFQSLFLYCYESGFFKPILLPLRHDVFLHNCEALGLELPPVSSSTKHQDHCIYYFDLCAAIADFQDENELTDEETCAAIYDFATMFDGDRKQSQELPSPTNVWLTGASGDDFKYLDTLGNDESAINPTNIWACNERTRRGDIVVIYARNPRSYIHSVWRADTAGMFNPFDYYHCRTHVRDGVKVPPITYNDLKTDSYFSQIPIVRKNLQGVNGWELTAKDYSELLRMIEERGGDTSALPHLFDGSAVDFGTIQNEHDVEENILIPALRKLGYTEADWTRQLSLKAGRKEKAIPDFVFFANGEHHFEHAPMVIEAKHDMSSMTEMQNAFRQGLSYARMLRASIMAICDEERIIVYHIDINGSSDLNNPVYENHWAKIFSDETEGAKLKQIIGREIVYSLL